MRALEGAEMAEALRIAPEQRYRIDLEGADLTIIGWKQAVMIELDRMRREMPYADTLELRLICERRDG